MLDSETKRRIDTCRDILVGKVPDPKSQVEQITIALIYKFMDDMDTEAEELGGSRTFFRGEFAKYRWSKLMEAGMGGFDTLSLYSEAIQRMTENPSLPQLFRDIFKNAYLPYRDPETLRIFLKEIDTFTYDHSERLGDAYEYLLSVLGSQGGAGQFRTPRHIIDFMVEIVDPKKNETILDPACGTAGFLISSYKHILKHNTKGFREQKDKQAFDEKGVPMEAVSLESPIRYKGDLLSPDERKRIAANIQGYDIAPDMVRLSLVNMYLHGFTDPHIFEYDTLTSDEKWNELADVILANPPFMSPKGGIKPHKRFSVQSKRSEVLFVDYIAEHLTPGGRAAVVVPEGIIFQSQTAYKKLREMLVKEYLVAVISLPAGVFNPYSGVKTSILVMDKRLAKQRGDILFVKIENDGFNLGAQRRPIEENDLPMAVRIVKAHLRRGELIEHKNVLAVSRERIGEKGEWNLSGERYSTKDIRTSVYDLVPFEEVCTLEYGASLPNRIRVKGPYPVMGSNGVSGYHNEYLVEGPAIIVGRKGSAGEVVIVQENCFPIDTTYYVKRVNADQCDLVYLYHLLKTLDLPSLRGGAGIPGLNRNDVYDNFKLPLPPLEIQEEIVAEIEGYQKIIDGARQVVENYQPHIPVDPDWPMMELGELCEGILTGPFGTSLHQSDYVDNGIPVVNPKNIVEGLIIAEGAKMVSPATRDRLSEFTIRENDIVIGRRGEMGRCAVATKEMTGWLCGTGCFVIRLTSALNPRFAFLQIASERVKTILEDQAVGVTMKNLNQSILSSIKLAVPDYDVQDTIVAEIEKEQHLVHANKALIRRFEEKIDQTIERVWGH